MNASNRNHRGRHLDFGQVLCDSIMNYCSQTNPNFRQMQLPPEEKAKSEKDVIRVMELFAGVGGFRVGLERASDKYQTIWNNQWEPSTKRQDASIVYQKRFGLTGHSNVDISTVNVSDIPDCDMLVGGFPCQDYSVANTLTRSGGIEGKKGVLWWQIYRILKNHRHRPDYVFLENVDRLLKSPAEQRGRDFAIILASLDDLGYIVEWRVINAADYGMPQRRKRTYILGYKKGSKIARRINDNSEWINLTGIMAKAFPLACDSVDRQDFDIQGTLPEVSATFNKKGKTSPFGEVGIMANRHVISQKAVPVYHGPVITLGDILLDEACVPEEYFIAPKELDKWEYLKGGKTEKRVNKSTGYEYNYSEGRMAFPDYTDRPSRTIITGEGGKGPSRFKHVVQTPSGRYRRLTPIELERLNMFPDNHTKEAPASRRAFLMGNALVTGIVERIGVCLLSGLG